MKWIYLVVAGVFSMANLAADEEGIFPTEMMSDEEALFSLDTEIEDFLEEDALDQKEIAQIDYDQIEPIYAKNAPPAEEKNSTQLKPENTVCQFSVEEEKQIPSLAVEIDNAAAQDEEMIVEVACPLSEIQEETASSIRAIEINLRQVFSGSPIIYSLLFLLSTVSVCVWLYSMLTIRSIEFLPPKLVKDLRTKLTSNQFDEALDLCVQQKHFFCRMLASGILARKHGLNVMIDTMKSEGKRSTVDFWQRINILNEIAIIAPMIGLLGTVLGMFYAFYDLNRSMESVSLLFDGLGISVGTTVAGLVVAIIAMILYSVAKYRLVKILASVENEAQGFAALIDTRSPN